MLRRGFVRECRRPGLTSALNARSQPLERDMPVHGRRVNMRGAQRAHDCFTRSQAIDMAGSPIRIGGETIEDLRHVCAFFNSQDDEYHVLLPFIRDGLEHGDCEVHVVATSMRQLHVERLRDAGIDVEAAERAGQLAIRVIDEMYLPAERFDPDTMLARVEAMLEAGTSHGYDRTRLVAHAEPVIARCEDPDDFVGYEARLNTILPSREHVVVCAYDLAQVNAGFAMDVLRTHPIVIIGNVLHQNPFYVPPGELLRELHERDQRREVQPR